MNILLAPGNFVCDLTGLPKDSDHRQILRMFVNTLFWGIVGGLAVILTLA